MTFLTFPLDGFLQNVLSSPREKTSLSQDVSAMQGLVFWECRSLALKNNVPDEFENPA
jgi:hypothetical protein